MTDTEMNERKKLRRKKNIDNIPPNLCVIILSPLQVGSMSLPHIFWKAPISYHGAQLQINNQISIILMIEYCLTKAETTPICQAPGNVTRYQTWVTMKISDKADKKNQ